MIGTQVPFDWNRQGVAEAERERDVAIDRVERSSGEWQVEALVTIRSIATSRAEFTTDDVWSVLGRDPDVEGRAMGAAMRSAAHLGLVERTERTTKSLRVACHRRDLRVWKSLLWGRPR